jgi:hypothetical protein
MRVPDISLMNICTFRIVCWKNSSGSIRLRDGSAYFPRKTPCTVGNSAGRSADHLRRLRRYPCLKRRKTRCPPGRSSGWKPLWEGGKSPSRWPPIPRAWWITQGNHSLHSDSGYKRGTRALFAAPSRQFSVRAGAAAILQRPVPYAMQGSLSVNFMPPVDRAFAKWASASATKRALPWHAEGQSMCLSV